MTPQEERQELIASVRPWLQNALTTFLQIRELSTAPDVRERPTSAPIRDQHARELLLDLNYPERKQDLTRAIYRDRLNRWVDDGWKVLGAVWDDYDEIEAADGATKLVGRGYGEGYLELVYASTIVMEHLFDGSNSNGRFDWSKLDHPLWNKTIRRLEQAGFCFDAQQSMGTPSAEAESSMPPLRGGDPPAVVVATDGDEQTETPDTKAALFKAMVADAGPVEYESGNWIESKRENKETLRLKVGSLGQYRKSRNGGWVGDGGWYGVDKDKRIWRKPDGYKTARDAPTFYYLPSLPKSGN